jgi:hypothetical protein
VVAVKELVFLRERVLIPAENLLAFISKRHCQPQLRADTVAIRPDMAHNAKRLMFAHRFEQAADDFRMGFQS